MKPYQQRVIQEKRDLDEKATRLSEFIGLSASFEALEPAEQERLKEQCEVMWQYSEMLGQRIAALPSAHEATASLDVVRPLAKHTATLGELRNRTLLALQAAREQLRKGPYEEGLTDVEFIEMVLEPFITDIKSDLYVASRAEAEETENA